MLTLNRGRLSETRMPVVTGWLLGSCMEARGKQDLWTRQNPEVLEILREQAIIQSVESSNRNEGVTYSLTGFAQSCWETPHRGTARRRISPAIEGRSTGFSPSGLRFRSHRKS